MRALLLVPLVSSSFGHCHGGNPPEPDAPPPKATTIDIMADQPLALVVFRDGVNAAWQPATMRSPTSFEAVVHGPYIVATVCDDGSGIFVTRQVAKTPDDTTTIDPFCGTIPATANRSLTGRMAQAGAVSFGADGEGNFAGGAWDFQFTVADGMYDLIGLTDTAIELRHGIAVSSDLAITPDVDVEQRGTALTPAAFSASNATADEQLTAFVTLDTTSTFGASVYDGPAATASVVPQSVLASSDDQEVEVDATTTTTANATQIEIGRSLERPFRAGDDTTFALPAPIGPISFSTATGTLVGTWTDRPAASGLFATSLGLSSDGMHSAANVVQTSINFLDATGVTQFTYATDLPGYQPQWKIDFTRQYHREIIFITEPGQDVTSNWRSERLNLGMVAGPAAKLLNAQVSSHQLHGDLPRWPGAEVRRARRAVAR